MSVYVLYAIVCVTKTNLLRLLNCLKDISLRSLYMHISLVALVLNLGRSSNNATNKKLKVLQGFCILKKIIARDISICRSSI